MMDSMLYSCTAHQDSLHQHLHSLQLAPSTEKQLL